MSWSTYSNFLRMRNQRGLLFFILLFSCATAANSFSKWLITTPDHAPIHTLWGNELYSTVNEQDVVTLGQEAQTTRYQLIRRRRTPLGGLLEPDTKLFHAVQLGDGGKDVLVKLFRNTPRTAARIEQQIKILETMSHHPNSITVHQVERRPGTTIVVLDSIRQPPNTFTSDDASNVDALLNVVREMRRHNIIHRSLSPNQSLGLGASGELVVMDYRCATQTTRTNDVLTQIPDGIDLRYASPELLSRKSYDRNTDLWSAGTILLEMQSSIYPFRKSNVLGSILEFLEKETTGERSSLDSTIAPLLRLLPADRQLPGGDRESERSDPEPTLWEWLVTPKNKPAVQTLLEKNPQWSRDRLGKDILACGKKYYLGRRVGAGAFGTVYKAYSAETGLPVAIKAISNYPRRDVQREIDAMQAMSDHANSVTLICGHARHLKSYIVMEYYQQGSLQNWKRPTEEQMRTILRGLRDALTAMRKRKVIHSDIKPTNILLGDDGEIKIADYGLAEVGKDESNDAPRGTIATMAPEEYFFQRSSNSDIWSAGITVIYLATRELPEPYTFKREQVAEFRDRFRPKLTGDALEFALRATEFDPAQRVRVLDRQSRFLGSI